MAEGASNVCLAGALRAMFSTHSSTSPAQPHASREVAVAALF